MSKKYSMKVRDEIIQKIKVSSREQLEGYCLRMLDFFDDGQLEEISLVFEKNESGTEHTGIKKNTERHMSQQYVKEKMDEIKEWFRQIEEDELYLEASEYEDYSGSYWDSDWVWEYSDPNGIGTKLTIAAEFAQDCLNDRRYEEAFDIFEGLLNLNVTAETDDEDISLDLEELNEEDITDMDLTKLALSVLYADYQLRKPEERAEGLYLYFDYSIFKDIHVEDMFRMGREELTEQDRFWEDWISLLETKTGTASSRLLQEAALYYGGTEGLTKIAERSFHSHPSMGLSVMNEYQQSHSYEEMLNFAEKAMKELEKGSRIRGEIAQEAAFAASCMNRLEETREYCYEAFYGLANVRSYLRLFGETEMAQRYGAKANAEIRTHRVKAESQFEDYALAFYAGDFENTKIRCGDPEISLGWTGKFTRMGLSLFLLYLYEGKKPGKAIAAIADQIGFEDIQEQKRDYLSFETKIQQECMEYHISIFWDYFQRWKNTTFMEQEEKDRYLSWIEKIAYNRADAIAGGQFRRHYSESARLLAALGEVKESMGSTGARMAIRTEFKKKFPRHSAFQSAMNSWLL